MDNKYALGSTKVAHEHHDAKLKETNTVLLCRFCGSSNLIFLLTVDDHHCQDCGQNQEDLPQGYSTGRSADY